MNRILLLLLLGLGFPAWAFPPAPYHLLYGTVRDRYGNPLTSTTAQVVLQTPSGTLLAAPVTPGLVPGQNFQLKVPMDAGIAPDAYEPGALLAGTSFKLVVLIGGVTNLPMEMTVYSSLGQPAHSTRVDLTLGVDSNGDGLPDAWEYAFLATLGSNVPLSSLNANSILTPDGRTLRQQYVLGTYPFDPADPLNVVFAGFNGTSPILQFPTVTGRSYTVVSSPDLRNWSPANFVLASDGLNGPSRAFYYAPNISTIRVLVTPPAPGTTKQFYRVQVQ